MYKLSMLILLLIFLSGCVDVATTGAQVVYNHNSLQKKFNDQYITMQIYRNLNKDKQQFADCNISISTFHNRVLLAGQVRYVRQRQQADKIASQIADVKRVYNQLRISSPSSSLTRISDAWITAKVKAKLIASEDIDATQIKVITENGTVYLMGMLLTQEADAAAEIASDTDGVERVVKIFSYLQVTNR